jgi:hypothetical protein
MLHPPPVPTPLTHPQEHTAMDNQIRRELRILKGYALFTTAILLVLSLAAFRQQ